jgi:hypothetical protein
MPDRDLASRREGPGTRDMLFDLGICIRSDTIYMSISYRREIRETAIDRKNADMAGSKPANSS